MDITGTQILKFQELYESLKLECIGQGNYVACHYCSRKLLEAAAEALKAPKKQEDTKVPACNYECLNAFERVCPSTDDGWHCTRDKGHSGDHVACGSEHAIHTWPNGKETGNENRG
jgi:hypothetical protein